MKNFEDIIGKVFGSLTVLSYNGKAGNGHHYLGTICSCGNTYEVIWNNLKRSNTTMCIVCARKLRAAKATKFDVNANRDEYTSYRSMLGRCLDKKHPSYSRYGAAGIEICTEWLPENNGFIIFLEEMGTRPEGYTLDRIDNAKGYSKDNCRWSKVSMQNHNKGKRSDAKTSEYIGVCKDKSSWRVQIMLDGVKISELYVTELEAAIAYDNHSERIYGDRPNSTLYQEVFVKQIKRGSVTQDKRTSKWRARLTLPDGKRLSLGSFLTKEEAEAKLADSTKEYYNE